MEPQIKIHGPLPSHLSDLIEAQVSKIKERFGRLTSFRIAVRAPGLHHRNGQMLLISIRAALPGRAEIDVSATSCNDPRQSNLTFAVNDAFHRIKQKLHRQAAMRAPRAIARAHRTPQKGRILSLDIAKGCGRISSEDGRTIYFHARSVLRHPFEDSIAGDRVAYHEEPGEKGPQASTVKLLKRRSHA